MRQELDELSSNLIEDINKSGIHDSNSNYIRFNNGKAIAWGNASFYVSGFAALGNIFYFEVGGLSLWLPITFTSLMIIPTVNWTSSGGCLQIQPQSNGSAITTIFGLCPTTEAKTVSFNYIAIGIWK